MQLLKGFTLAVISLAHIWASPSAVAQDAATSFPTKTVRIVVPFPAGGPSDVLARVIAENLSAEWGKPVIVENRAGGNTAIGASAVARSDPDGHTLLAAMDTTLVMNPIVNANSGYDIKDFALISLTSTNPILLLVPEAGPKTFDELKANSAKTPGKTNFGAGIITNRLAGLMLSRAADLQAQLIPFTGSAQVLQAMLSGSIDFGIDGPATNVALVQSGRLRALAKFSNTPIPSLPDVQPISKVMGKQFDDVVTWTSLVAPPGTPPSVVQKIYQTLKKIYSDSKFVARLEAAGITATISTPEELTQFVRKETERWTPIVRESGISLN